MLELLQAHGEIGVAGRAGKQRLWDIAERVYPPCETIPWREAERLIQAKTRRSLGVWRERGQWHAHSAVSDEPVPDRVVFLSPFDRLIHDRDRAEALFGFHYRLEMYVPGPSAGTATTCCRSCAVNASSAASISSATAPPTFCGSTASGGRTASNLCRSSRRSPSSQRSCAAPKHRQRVRPAGQRDPSPASRDDAAERRAEEDT